MLILPFLFGLKKATLRGILQRDELIRASLNFSERKENATREIILTGNGYRA